MTTEEAVEKLYSVPSRDPESAHSQADDILLLWIRANGGEKVADAFERVSTEIGFWYA